MCPISSSLLSIHIRLSSRYCRQAASISTRRAFRSAAVFRCSASSAWINSFSFEATSRRADSETDTGLSEEAIYGPKIGHIRVITIQIEAHTKREPDERLTDAEIATPRAATTINTRIATSVNTASALSLAPDRSTVPPLKTVNTVAYSNITYIRMTVVGRIT